MSVWNDDDWGSVDANAIGLTQQLNGSGASQTNNNNTHDKIPIPITITDLNELMGGDEKINIGNAFFSMVRVMGTVVRTKIAAGGQSVDYEIADPKSRFLVTFYKGVVSPAEDDPMGLGNIAEGTLVAVIGKIKNFNSQLCILAFIVREVEDRREYETFLLEARLAKLYYTKNIPELVAAGNLSRFSDTMLRGKESAQVAVGASRSEGTYGGVMAPPPVQTNFPSIAKPNSAVNMLQNLSAQRAEIVRYLCAKGKNEIGVSVDEIQRAIPVNIQNVRTFDHDMLFLASKGFITSTNEDDHFVINF